MDWVTIIGAVGVYFLPYLVADLRGHHNGLAIFGLNLLLGWTVLGWVAAMVWALTAVRREPGAAPKRPLSERLGDFLNGR